MSQVAEHPLEAGRQAASRFAWREAFDHLRQADGSEDLTAQDLEALGESAWWMGNLKASLDAFERAFPLYREAGDPEGAARVAIELAHAYSMGGQGSLAGGWLSRAERILEGLPENVQHGYLARTKAGATLDEDLEAALAYARQTLEIGERLGDPNLQALGLHDQGRALIRKGEVEPGLRLMEEAVVAAVGGELHPYATGVIYCNAINICQELADYTRAGEWTDAARRWCERQSITGFPGICRVRKAEIVRLRGGWAEAEREARQALDELKDWYVEIAAAGFFEIGGIRLRMGDLDAAEEAFRQADQMGESPQPGLAMVRLAQGKAEAAARMLRRALEETSDRLARSRLLPAWVVAALAAGEEPAAAEAVEELEETTQTYDSPALRAEAAVARGRLHLARGEAEEAVASFRAGARLWREVEAPYEAALARMLAGEAYRAAGDEESAVLELESARSAFERLGAVLDLRRAHDLLGDDGRPAGRPERAERTFMFTDVVGSTTLAEALGDESWQSLLRWHDQTLRSLFAAHGGEEVKHTGDGFFVAFDDAAAAVECAVAIQRGLAGHRHEQGFSPQVRIGVHAAPADRVGGDYRGKGIHEAARIGAVAGPDEVVASRETAEAARARFPVSEPRAVELKGINRPVEVVTIAWR